MALSIPIEVDIEITSGDDQTFTQTIKDKAGVSDVDFSDYDYIFTVKRSKTEYDSDANIIYQLKSTSGEINISTTGTPLETTITVDHWARESALVTSTPLPPGTYYYDLQFKTGVNKIQTWWKGKYKITWHSTVSTT